MSIETVAARLTEAVYPVALRHGTVDSWIDLELDLWKVLTATLRQMGTDGLELPEDRSRVSSFVTDKTFSR